jgi:hypothetical protein
MHAEMGLFPLDVGGQAHFSAFGVHANGTPGEPKNGPVPRGL